MKPTVSFSLLLPWMIMAWSRCQWCAMADTDLESLPWSDLTTKGQLIDTSPTDYINQCYNPTFSQLPRDERTMHDLIKQPSGLCMGFLFNGFEQCTPDELYLNGQINATVSFFTAIVPFLMQEPPFGENVTKLLDPLLDSSNPAYNVPPKVLFPQHAGDVVAAVNFAKQHGVQISVKNSGHSYAGSSMKKDTMLINMMQYKRYASDDKETMGITECDEESVATDISETLDNQPCHLARARGKPAVLRVGGGENFDKAYRTVKAFNEKEEQAGNRYKYHMVGGAAGTVSPMGWTWQGGLAATTGGRMFGFGVDQVLQIEAVLPSGQHVRFGPTSWEDNDENSNYVYPRTTMVSGVCNENSMDDESQWVWKPCADDIPFEDLWFAFRGGGGGTWGVVLSVSLQLHDYLPLVKVQASDSCASILYNATAEGDILLGLMAEFALNYYLDPDVLSITKEESNACGVPSGDLISTFFCLASNATAIADTVTSSFSKFVESNLPQNVSKEVADIATNCLVATTHKDYAETVLITEGPYAGQATDTIGPGYSSDVAYEINQMLPKAWILKNKPFLIDFLKGKPKGLYFAFGGDAEFAQDQMTSLSTAHREAGAMIFYVAQEEPWSSMFSEMFDFSTDAIPPMFGSNHLGPTTYGPLKSNHTQPCPVWFLTSLEAEALCVSAQEAIYGTETLTRLESIKESIDPNHMFDCFRCVGNKVIKDDAPSQPTTTTEEDATTTVTTEEDATTKEDSKEDVAVEEKPDSTEDVAVEEKEDATEDETSSATTALFVFPTSVMLLSIGAALLC